MSEVPEWEARVAVWELVMGLHITREQIIAGVPALDARKLMQRAGDYQFEGGKAEFVCQILGVDEDSGKRIQGELLATGYIRKAEHQISYSDGVLYELTDLGHELAKARAGKRVARATAEKALLEAVLRAREVNEGKRPFVYRIATLIVYGSYVRGETKLGDVDVALELTPLYENAAQRRADGERISRAYQDGRRFSNIVQKFYWPREEVQRFIKGRSPVLSIHDIHDFLGMTKDANFAYKVIIGNADDVAKRLEERENERLEKSETVH